MCQYSVCCRAGKPAVTVWYDRSSTVEWPAGSCARHWPSWLLVHSLPPVLWIWLARLSAEVWGAGIQWAGISTGEGGYSCFISASSACHLVMPSPADSLGEDIMFLGSPVAPYVHPFIRSSTYGLWGSNVPWFMCRYRHYINCLFVCLLNFLPYFLFPYAFFSYLLTSLLVYFQTYLSTFTRIDPIRFQVGGHRS